MRRADTEAMRNLDEIIFTAQALKQRYLTVIDVADAVQLNSGWSTDGVSTSTISDPTASIALSDQRMAKQSGVTTIRRNLRSSSDLMRGAAITAGIILEAG